MTSGSNSKLEREPERAVFYMKHEIDISRLNHDRKADGGGDFSLSLPASYHIRLGGSLSLGVASRVCK